MFARSMSRFLESNQGAARVGRKTWSLRSNSLELLEFADRENRFEVRSHWGLHVSRTLSNGMLKDCSRVLSASC